MSETTVVFHCPLCMERAERKIKVPDGWVVSCGIDEERHALCPNHAAIDGFKDAQCPGCVGVWSDCPLFDAFAYSGRRSMMDDDYTALARGVCPRRVNGTFTITSGHLDALDLSERAVDESGAALAQAIRDYIQAFPDDH